MAKLHACMPRQLNGFLQAIKMYKFKLQLQLQLWEVRFCDFNSWYFCANVNIKR